MTFQLNKTTILSTIALVFAVMLVYAAQTSAAGGSFGFEKNTHNRKSADAEGVAGCMQSCTDMFAGLGEMNPDSKNYTRKLQKIAAKAEQCLAMNVLAGSPFSEEEILTSCGLGQESECKEIPWDISIDSGACGSISFIEETNLPQCCTQDRPGGIDCGADAEWVVGVAAFPVCYISNS